MFWLKLGRGARAGLVVGVLAILVATVLAGWWLLAPDYQVLFADLAPQDMAAMAGELDKSKTPYRLGEDGTSILVDKDQVYKTRMKLMGKELPLHGAVGFELFNNSDFGMTEFAQKINYQRALQGEITRTVLSLSQIRDARVLLVLPDQGLFKQAANKAKASITLTMKPAQSLRPEQVAGIQRLVSASVPGIASADVVVLDQNGVALSRNAASGDEGDTASTGRLDLKKETENYLARKAAEILERTFGPGQAMATVDVVLNADRTQVTTEDVVTPPGRAGHATTGVMVRERETLHEGAAPLDAKNGDAAGGARPGSSQRDVEYAVGRRVEQIVSQPGSIRRLQAVAVVRQPLDAAQQEQIRRVLAAAVGASFERGDTVVVHTLEGAAMFGSGAGASAPWVAHPALRHGAPAASGVSPKQASMQSMSDLQIAFALLFALVIGVVCVLLFLGRFTPSSEAARRQAALSEAQRQAVLVKVQTWLAADTVHAVGEPR